MDTEGDAERALEFAEEVVADPSYVAAVVAPFWSEPPEVASALAGAGVPTFSLSPQSPSPEVGTQGLWRRFVPDASLQVSALADAVEAGMSGAVDEAARRTGVHRSGGLARIDRPAARSRRDPRS